MSAPQLDLDQFDTEQSLMEQIEGDAALMSMISEMFFEQHYNDFDVRTFPCAAGWPASAMPAVDQHYLQLLGICPPSSTTVFRIPP